MKRLNKAMIPLLLALISLGVVVFMLPFGAEAHQNEPNTGPLALNPQVLPGMDIELSNGTNSSLPEIATSGTSVAVVFVKNNRVYLRWAQTKWANNKLLHSVQGGTPKIAFLTGSTGTVHIVWAGYGVGGSVAGLPQRAIRHISCIMNVEPTVNCSSVTDIATTSFVTTTLSTPDIAIDGNGRLHVAWVENAGGTVTIHTRRSINPNDGVNWGAVANVSVSGGANAGQPALATTNNNVHLLYRDFLGGTGWQIYYKRTSIGSEPHVWANVVGGGPFNEVLNHAKFSNPTIAAGNNRIFMAWDTQNATTLNMYGLIGISNTNEGSSGAWSNTRDITSTTVVNGATPPTDRRSHDGAVPPTENELRPSVAFSGTSNFVIVWQERHDDTCPGGGGIEAGSHLGQNGTSEIYYAESQSNGWGTLVDTLSNNTAEYSIDPDIAIDTQGKRHIVFMKATTIGTGPNCKDGGDSAGYAIYYRGPVTEKWPENNVYLPVLAKGSSL